MGTSAGRRDGKHSEGRSHEESGVGILGWKEGVSEQRLPFEGKEEGRE